MAAKKFRLRVVTPREIKIDENVEMVIMRCTTGDMGILPRHEPYSAVLNYGPLRVLNNGKERRIAVFGGLAEVQNNVLTVLTSGAEWPEDIDRSRAMADLEQYERRLQEQVEDIEIRDDQVLLRRALVRLEVSSYPLVNVRDHE